MKRGIIDQHKQGARFVGFPLFRFRGFRFRLPLFSYQRTEQNRPRPLRLQGLVCLCAFIIHLCAVLVNSFLKKFLIFFSFVKTAQKRVGGLVWKIVQFAQTRTGVPGNFSLRSEFLNLTKSIFKTHEIKFPSSRKFDFRPKFAYNIIVRKNNIGDERTLPNPCPSYIHKRNV